MEEPLIFYRYCDLIENEKYNYCIECYRYDTCKKAYEKEHEAES